MKELLGEDIYLISTIIDKMDLKMPDITKIEVDAKGRQTKIEKTQTELGAEILLMITKKIHLAQESINQLLAKTTEKTVEEINNMPLKEMFKLVAELFGKAEFADFFK